MYNCNKTIKWLSFISCCTNTKNCKSTYLSNKNLMTALLIIFVHVNSLVLMHFFKYTFLHCAVKYT